MTTSKTVFWLLASTTLAACGSDPKPPPTGPQGDMGPPMATAQAAPSNPKPDDDPTKSQIRISDEIKRACGISDAEAYFAFDSANVRPSDKAVLQKLAKCFADGPLKGRQMRLVGHADPRGESEYNMVLGGKRADNVKGFLTNEGLPDGQVQTTSRGELDAVGTDESSWSEDRRVDVVLAD
jgi:peptidoglycan-associated lipoprotein